MDSLPQLFTQVEIPAFEPRIRYQDQITMIGSCFTEHISQKLIRYKYEVLQNPFGILYNPASMARSLDRIVKLQYYDHEELVYLGGLYHSMDHHGSFSGKEKDEVISKINASIDDAHKKLKTSAFVFLSPGTSNVYTYKSTGAIVGNCHKIPQSEFDFSRLSLEACEKSMDDISTSIKSFAPDATIIWTVSPVRHVRDGMIENQLSKSVLLLAIDQQLKKHTGSHYFPAYEIMMDQLRDYRYYARDLIHPSDVAIDIIWNLFCHTYLDAEDRTHHTQIEKIKKAMDHRLLHDDIESIKPFAQGQLKKIDQLANLLADLNWQEERQYFFSLLEQD